MRDAFNLHYTLYAGNLGINTNGKTSMDNAIYDDHTSCYDAGFGNFLVNQFGVATSTFGQH